MKRLVALANRISSVVAIIVIGITVGSIFSSVQTADAQNLSSAGIDNSNTTTSLGDPFFVEEGSIVGQRVLSVSPQPQLEFTVVANATINGNISATNTGTTVGDLQPNGVFRSTGQGFIMMIIHDDVHPSSFNCLIYAIFFIVSNVTDCGDASNTLHLALLPFVSAHIF